MSANEYNRSQLDKELLSVEHITEMVKLWQEEHGLTTDGYFGPNTAKSFEDVIPTDGWRTDSGRSWAENKYGKFRFKSQSNGRIKISPKWVKENIVYVKLHTGKRIRLHKAVAEDFVVSFRNACEASGYTPKSVQTFVTRHTLWNPKKSLSCHSWGIAIDFDPPKNPMGGRIKSSGKPSMLRQHIEFVDTLEADGWTWGGRWRMKDDMHFEKR